MLRVYVKGLREGSGFNVPILVPCLPQAEALFVIEMSIEQTCIRRRPEGLSHHANSHGHASSCFP